MHFGLVAGYCDGELLRGEDGEPVTYQYMDFGVGEGEGGRVGIGRDVPSALTVIRPLSTHLKLKVLV